MDKLLFSIFWRCSWDVCALTLKKFHISFAVFLNFFGDIPEGFVHWLKIILKNYEKVNLKMFNILSL